MKKSNEKYPEGHFLGYGIAIGIPLGMPIGLALGNIAYGPGIGLILGAILGTFWENKYKKEGKIRPLTKKEKQTIKRNQKFVLIIGVIVAILLVLAYLFLK